MRQTQAKRSGAHGAMAGMMGGIVAWVSLFLFWLLLAQSLLLAECVAGAIGAGMGAAGMLIGRRCVAGGGRPKIRDFKPLLSVPVSMAMDAWRVTRAVLLRAAGHSLGGSLVSVPDPAGEHRRTLRETIATTCTSVAPNSIVLGVDRSRGVVLYHQFTPAPTPSTLRPIQDPLPVAGGKEAP